MKHDEITPAELSAGTERASNAVPAARRAPVHVMVDGVDIGATVKDVTVNALGVILWAES